MGYWGHEGYFVKEGERAKTRKREMLPHEVIEERKAAAELASFKSEAMSLARSIVNDVFNRATSMWGVGPGSYRSRWDI